MALIDEEIVRMKFENADFNNDIQDSISSIDELDEKLDDLSDNKGLKGLEEETEQVSIKFDALRIAVETAVYRIVNSVVDGVAIIKNKLDSVTIDPIMMGFSKYEEKINAVQTIMNATGMTIEEVENRLEKLTWFTDETSYDFSEMVSTLSKFTAAGVGLDESVTAMIGIANWAGTAGVNAQRANRAFYNLSQAIGSGSIKVRDWVSIEAINMNTAEFMNTVIETGKEWTRLGETYSDFIEKYGQNSTQFAELVRKNGDTMDDAMKYVRYFEQGLSPKDVGWEGVTSGNFRDTLANGWFTSELFNETMKKYGDFTEQIYKFQNENNIDTASEAIREYNNQFADLIDTTYEAYKKFGRNSEQFRNVLNENGISLQTAMDFVSVKEARLFNENLESLAESLKKTSDEFGFESEEFAKAANEAGYSVQDAAEMVTNGIEKFQKAERSLGQKGIQASQEARTFTDAWESAITGVASQWSRFWQLIFGNYEEARDMWTELSEVLWETFAGPIAELNSVIKMVVEAGGRLNIIDGIKNIWHALQSVIDPIKEALSDVFGFFAPDENGEYRNAAEYIYALTEAFRRWSETLNEMRGRFYEIKNIATGVFSALKLVVDVVGNVISNLGRVIKAILPNFGRIFTLVSQVFSNLGGFEEIADSINAAVTDFTDKLVFRILQVKIVILVVLAAIVEKIQETFETVKVMFLIFMGEFDKALETNADLVSNMQKSGVYDKILKLREVFNRAGEAFTVFSEKVQNKVLPIINKLKEKIPEAITKIIKVVADIGNIGWFIFDVVSSIVTSAAELFGVLILGPAEAAEGLTPLNTIAAIFQGLAPVINLVVEMIKTLITGITAFVRNINIWKAAGLVLLEGIISGKITLEKVFEDITWDLSNFLKGLGVPVDGIKNIFGGIKKAIEGMFEAFAETTWLEATATMVRSFAWSLLILAGSALILSTLDYGKLAASFAVITGFLWEMYTAVTALVGLMEHMEGAKSISYLPFLNIPLTPLFNITVALLGFASAIFILSAAVLNLGKTFGKYGPEAFGGAVASLTVGMYGMVGAITSLMYAIRPLTKYSTGAKVLAEMVGLSVLLKSFAASFVVMSIAVRILGSADLPSLAKGVGSIVVLLAAIVGFARFIKLKETTVGELFGIAGAIMLFALAINMLVIPVELLGHMRLEKMVQGLFGIATLLAGFIGTVFFIDSFDIQVTAGKLLGIAAAMVIFAVAVDLLSIPVLTMGSMPWYKMLQGLAGVGALIVGLVWFTNSIDEFNLNNTALEMLALSASTLILAVAVNALAVAVISMSKLKFEDLLKGLFGVAAEMALMAAFIWAINKVIGGVPEKIIALSISLLAISVSIGILTLSLLSIAKLTEAQQLNGIVGLLGIFVEIALFLFAIKKIDPSGIELIKISIGLIALSAGMLLMTVALGALSKIDFLELIGSMLKLVIILVAVAALSKLLSSFAGPMITFGISVGIVGAGLFLLGVGIDAMHTALENIANDPNIRAFADTVIEGIATALEGLKPLMDTVKEAWSDMWEEMTRGWRNFWAFINGDTTVLGDPNAYYGGTNTSVSSNPYNNPFGTESKGHFDEIVRAEAQKTGQQWGEGYKEGADSVDLSVLPKELRPENKGNFDAYVHDEMQKTGQNGAQGFKEGYESVDLTPLPVATSDTLLTGLETSLDEHSPSKKTYKIGKYATLGFAAGIKDKNANDELKNNLNALLSDTSFAPQADKVKDDRLIWGKEAYETGSYAGHKAVEGAEDGIKSHSNEISDATKEIDRIIDESMSSVSEEVEKGTSEVDIKKSLVDSLLGGLDDSKVLNDEQKKWIREKVNDVVDMLDIDSITGDIFNFDDIKDQIKGAFNFGDIEIPEIENPFDNGGEGLKLPDIELPDASGLDGINLDFSNLTGTTNNLSDSIAGLNGNLANTGDLANSLSLSDIFGTSDLATKAEAEGAAIGDGIKTGITDSTRKLTYNDIIHRNAIMRAAQKDGIWSESFDKALKAAGYTDDFYSTADRLKIYNEARATRTANFSDRINIKDSAELYRLITTLTDHGVMSDEFENALRSYYGDDYKELTAKEKNDLVASLTDAYAKEEEFIANNYEAILKAYESGQGSAAFKEMFNLSGSSDRDINDFIDRTKAYKNYQDRLQNESEKQGKDIKTMSDIATAFNQVVDTDGVKVTMAKAKTDVLESALKVIESSTQKDGVKKNSLEYVQALDQLNWSYEDAEQYLKLKAEEDKKKTGGTTATTQQKTTTSSTSETKANTTSTYNPVTTVKADNVTVDTKNTTATAQTSTQVAGDITGYIKEGVQKLTNIDATITLMNTKIDQMAETIVVMNETALNELALLNGWKGESGAHNAAVAVRLANIQNRGVPIANRASFMQEVAESTDAYLGNKVTRRARGN